MAAIGGRPCIRGLRITVTTVLNLLASSSSRKPILEVYPQLEPANIEATLTYTARYGCKGQGHSALSAADPLAPKHLPR